MEYRITTICRVLGVSRSGYYDWVNREPSDRALEDAELTDLIKVSHKESRGTYGARRVHADLVVQERRVSVKRVARLMKSAGLCGVCRRKSHRTTRRGHHRGAPDRVERNFSADGPDKLWVADITYIPTWAGVLYLAIVLDVWSRKIVGWAMATHMRAELVVSALDMAIAARQPLNVIHHSDHGSQYTALRTGARCEAAGIVMSMGSVGDCYDNAMAESFFASLECELIDRTTLRTPVEARAAVFDYIEGFYNPHRRHSALGLVSPVNFEYATLQPVVV